MYHHSVSIIIPVYNGSKTLKLCLESVFNSYYRNFECIVVDDHSIDNTVMIAESFDTKIIKLPRQRGVANARNRGAEVARGNILLFVDADVTIYPDSLEKVVKDFEENPDVSAVFGSYDDQPGCANFFSQYKNLFHHYIHQTSREDASTFWAGCGAVKKETFHAVGGFDQKKYSMPCIEDIEMGCRMTNMGYRILLDKQLRVKHLKHFSFLKLIKSDIFDRAIPWTVMMLTNKQFANDLNLKAKHKFSAAILILVIFSIFMTTKLIWFIFPISALLAIILFLNYDFYTFFLKKKGLIFTLRVVPLHFLYYLYSTLGFIMGYCMYLYTKHHADERR